MSRRSRFIAALVVAIVVAGCSNSPSTYGHPDVYDVVVGSFNTLVVVSNAIDVTVPRDPLYDRYVVVREYASSLYSKANDVGKWVQLRDAVGVAVGAYGDYTFSPERSSPTTSEGAALTVALDELESVCVDIQTS